MDNVDCLFDGRWRFLLAKNCDESIRRLPLRCHECHAPAYMLISKNGKIFFGSNFHSPSCGLAVGGRKFRDPDGNVFRLDDICNHIDGPYDPHALAPGANPAIVLPADDDVRDRPVDLILDDRPRTITRASTLYNAVRGMNLDEHVTPDLLVRDFSVDERTIESARNNGLTGLRLMCGVKFDFKQLYPELIWDRRKYICLRDPYTERTPEAIFFLIRVREASQDRRLRDLLFGEESKNVPPGRSQKVIFLGRVTPVPDDNYTIYRVSDLNTWSYSIVTVRSVHNR